METRALIEKVKTKVAGAVLIGAAALTGAGCSAPEVPAAPKGTLEQVAQTVEAPELSKLPVSQALSFETTTGEQVKVYNLTKQPLDESRFKRTVNYFATPGKQPATYPFTANPEIKDGTTSVLPRVAAEHDFVLVEPDADVPSSLLAGAKAMTHYYPEHVQTVSVISRPDDKPGQPGNFDTSKSLVTEVCQAMVDVSVAHDASTDPYARAANKRLAQEQVCNSLGLAAHEAGNGQSYESYVQAVVPETKLPFTLNGTTYDISSFTISPQEYAGMRQSLAG